MLTRLACIFKSTWTSSRQIEPVRIYGVYVHFRLQPNEPFHAVLRFTMLVG
ncbi:MAG: hypothetical protein ACTSXP_01165 [Promethearchaeota archaeon]